MIKYVLIGFQVGARPQNKGSDYKFSLRSSGKDENYFLGLYLKKQSTLQCKGLKYFLHNHFFELI